MPKELSEKERVAFALSPAFAKAAQRESKQLLKLPNTDELLELYGLYKVGCDEDISGPDAFPTGRPSIFNLKGAKKFDYWTKILDEGLTAEEARDRYVAKVEELKNKYGFDASKEPEVVGSS
ncbi:acyl CoA binding protein-domain-containing protein [Nemania sp. NC0429]|nr:acyl CoA binding protein-domain-containing protein [Nemania sp. NC0429]